MYGIIRNDRDILCTEVSSNVVQKIDFTSGSVSIWAHKDFCANPYMESSRRHVNNRLQNLQKIYSKDTLDVYEFPEDFSRELTVRRLKGY
jgi:hypothetical protein